MKHALLLRSGMAVLALGCSSLAATAAIYPTTWSNFSQGHRANGSNVLAIRSNADKAVGAPQMSDAGSVSTETASSINYVSLGFGGSIDLHFATPFANGAGADLHLFETSYGNPSCNVHPEKARVYASQSGMDGTWVLVGDACMNVELSLPAGMPWAQHVRIVDISNAAQFSREQDGYDVDGISANYVYMPPRPIPPPVCGGVAPADTFLNYMQGTQKSGAALPLVRRNPLKAVGMPEMNDASGQYNFTSLGFNNATPGTGGEITLWFPYTIMDAFGVDLFVFETSWGDNPSKNNAFYPEMAEFWGSADGVNWTMLANVDETGVPSGQLCRDGKLDISGMPGGMLNYLKIIDKTNRNMFNSAGDGYDVDGVAPAACLAGARVGAFDYDPNSVIDESDDFMNVSVKPNPVQSGKAVTISFATGTDSDLSIDLFDVTGKKLQSLQAGRFEAGNHEIQWNASGDINPGMYFIRVSGNGVSSVGTRVMVTK